MDCWSRHVEALSAGCCPSQLPGGVPTHSSLFYIDLNALQFLQVLDVASASGEPAATIARALPSATVLATDLAAEFVELGRARAESLRLPNLVCQQADAEALTQFSEGSFDAAVCCMGLM